MFLAILIIRVGLALALVLFGIDQIRRPALWLSASGTHSFLNPSVSVIRYWGIAAILIGTLLLIGVHLVVVGWLVLAWWMWGSSMDFRRDWSLGVRDMVIGIMTLALIILVS